MVGPDGGPASLVYHPLTETGSIDRTKSFKSVEFIETRADPIVNGKSFFKAENWLIGQPVSGPWRVLGTGKYSVARQNFSASAPTREALVRQLFGATVARAEEAANVERWRMKQAAERAAAVAAAERAADDARAAASPEYAARRQGAGAFAAYLRNLPHANASYSVEPGIWRLRDLLAMPGLGSSDAEWANRRIAEIDRVESQMRSQQLAPASGRSTYVAAAPTDSWAQYRQQSANHQSTLKALQDYTYGRSNQYPFSYYSR